MTQTIKSKKDFSRLENDLNNDFDKKIWRLCMDSIKLFELGGSMPTNALILITTTLLDNAAKFLALSNQNEKPPDIGKHFAENVAYHQQHVKEYMKEK